MATLRQAKAAFTEMKSLVNQRQEPAIYDLAVGLERLADALAKELDDVKRQIHRVEQRTR